MRNAPLNYLAAFALAGVLWFVTAIPLGNYLAENVALAKMDTGQFVAIYRAGLAIAAALGFISCTYWFYYGSRERVAGDMGAACRVWNLWFIGEIGAAMLVIGGFVAAYTNEALVLTDYLIVGGVASVLTWFLYWIGTWVMSPRTVMYCVLGRR